MKVLLINGSPHKDGSTFAALCEVENELNKLGIETEIFHVGKEPIRGCMGCSHCKKNKTYKCVFDNDSVNVFLEKAATADGFVFGSPVHFAAASGALTSFMDRAFYCGKVFENKPAASIVCCRRGGSTAALDQINKYFTIRNMPVVSSLYWNMIHGNNAEEIKQDLEGLQIMRNLGKNMAWLLKCIDAGKNAGVALPQREELIRTNFVR